MCGTEVEGLAEHAADASDGEHEKQMERHADYPPGSNRVRGLRIGDWGLGVRD